ncbi:MAG: pilus assembly protein PilM, partial [bacterium]|nr:pilus assembly protein PilM [bacterium]
QLTRSAVGWQVGGATMTEAAPSERDGGIHDHERLMAVIRNGLKERTFKGRSAVSTLPENQVDIFPIKLSLKLDEDLEEALVKEAQSYLTYDLSEAVIDYMIVQNDDFGSEQNRTIKLLLIGARRAHVEAHLALLKGAGLKPLAIEIPSCALNRAFRFAGKGLEQSLLIMNMDETMTTLTGLRNQTILFERSIPAGRDTLISGLCQQLKLGREKSKDLLNRMELGQDGDDPQLQESSKGLAETYMTQTLVEIVNPELEKLAQEVEKVLIYYASEMRGATIDEIALTGRCGSIAEMDRWMASRIQIPTSLFDPDPVPGVMETTSLLGENARRRTGFTVALGLALRGVTIPSRVEETVTS